MRVDWDIERVENVPNGIITVGTFDGVHLGHRFIIENVQARAKALGAATTVVTFEPHPQLVLRRANKPDIHILTTAEEKIRIFQELGIDRLVILKFTPAFANTPSEDFVRNVLYEKIGFREIVIGHDHGFGKNREGDFHTLLTLGRELGFTVHQLEAFRLDGLRVSSSKIRQALLAGDVALAAKLLGRPYALSGRVVRGEGRGKDLRFPTANIEPEGPAKLIPADGVYAVRVTLAQGQHHKGMMNIGRRPTFNSNAGRRVVEVHLFDFDDDLYGCPITVEFVQRLREERPFAHAEALIEQLKKDKKRSLEIL